MQTRTTRPASTEYADWYARYVAMVPAGDIVEVLRTHGASLDARLRAVPESRGGYRYAEGKWSIREMVGHMADAERVFAYRALRLARGDRTPLAGFDQDDYVAASGADARALTDLVDELRAVREGTVRLFASFAEDAWSRTGVASDKEVSVRAMAFITAGHAMHHEAVLAERYLVPA